MDCARINRSWQAFAVSHGHQPSATRVAVLERHLLRAAIDISAGHKVITLFGEQLRVDQLNIHSINRLLREEGSQFRLFISNRDVLLARIAKEEILPGSETYYFQGETLFSNLSQAEAVIITADGSLVAVREDLLTPSPDMISCGPQPLSLGITLHPAVAAERAIELVESQKAAQQTATYFEMIPVDFKDNVIRIAQKSYKTKSLGMAPDTFLETLARLWLINKIAFELTAKAEGFRLLQKDEVIPAASDSAIFLLTLSGSIIGLSKPDPQSGIRSLFYQRIQLRQDTDIENTGETKLDEPFKIGKEANLPGCFTTSPVIALATNPDAAHGIIRGAVKAVTQVINGVGQSVWPEKQV